MKCRLMFCLGLAVVLTFSLAACSGKKPEGEGAPAGMAPAAAHAPAGGGHDTPGLHFEAPAEWTAESVSSSMRKAQYRLPREQGDTEDAELVVYHFPGEGGPVQDNIERWIGQFTKPDGGPATDLATTSGAVINGINVTVVDVSGTYMSASGPMLAEVAAKPGYRMLAAVAETPAGPWFFKLTGPERTVAKRQPEFQALLNSLHLH